MMNKMVSGLLKMKLVKRRYLRYFLFLMMTISVLGSVAQDTPKMESMNDMPRARRMEQAPENQATEGGVGSAEGDVNASVDGTDIQKAQNEAANQGNKGFSSQTTEKFRSLSSLEFGLSLLVLLFGMGVILLEIYLVTKQHISATETVKFIIITLIIISTLFLITAGYDNDQIAPAIGLLGTIAGYLLGRITNEDKPKGGDGSGGSLPLNPLNPPSPPSV